jgi:hypothetical protein
MISPSRIGGAECRAGGESASFAFNAGAYISGFQQLTRFGARFYPVHRDKSPAVRGSLNQAATSDPIKIAFWAEHCHHRNFAARLLKESNLLVIDTEDPWKDPNRLGPDGEMFLGSLLEDSDITLPLGPIVQTPSGGFHRYLLVPKGLPIRPRVALWPGIDILSAGSSVILPGSRTDRGDYRALRTLDEWTIPEAPRQFVKLIRSTQTDGRCPTRRDRIGAEYMDAINTSNVCRRQWWLLFRNRVFQSFWERRGKAGDATDSAYEYHLAKACFCCGLNFLQTEAVILSWRRKHSLNRDLRQLQHGILPKAWSEVAVWVERWHTEREAAKESRKAKKTANMILSFVKSEGNPQMPAAVSAALAIPRERVKKAMQRMAERGKLLSTGEGYEFRH